MKIKTQENQRLNIASTLGDLPTKILNIISAHDTLTEAVNESGYDLSYNPSIGNQRIKETEHWGSGAAYVVEGGDIYYMFQHEGNSFFNKFSPFVTSISGGPLQSVNIKEESGVIEIGQYYFKNNTETRKLAKKFNMILG